MKKIKTIIADDHKIFRDGLAFALSTIDNIELTAQAENGEELLQVTDNQKFDIVFMDINMPKMNGIEASRKLRELNSDIKIIAMSSYEEIDIVKKSLDAGMDAYLLKNADYIEIKQAIETVLTDEIYFSKTILNLLTKDSLKKAKQIKNKKTLEKLTKREMQVLELLTDGMNAEQVAEKLFISKRTVEKHKQNIMGKFQVKSAPQLIAFVRKNELF